MKSREELLSTVLQVVTQWLQGRGQIGRGSGQMSQEFVAALVDRLSTAELRDTKRRQLELVTSFEIAPAVLWPQTGPKEQMGDLFLRDVLVRVAALTASGTLEEGASAIDQALSQAQQGYQGAPSTSWLRRMFVRALEHRVSRWQRDVLLVAAIRQGGLLRDAERVASATPARSGLSDTVRPAWSQSYTERMEAMHKKGLDDDTNFPPRVASAMARHRAESARTAEERGGAFMKVATPLMVLADREPGEAVLNEARTALMHASQEFRAAGLEHDAALARTCIAAVDERLAQYKAATALAPAPAPPCGPHTATVASLPSPAAAVRPQPQPESRAARHINVPMADPAAASPAQPEARQTPREQASTAKCSEALSIELQSVVDCWQAEGRAGAAPGQLPMTALLAVAHRLQASEHYDNGRAQHDLGIALEVAPDVVGNGRHNAKAARDSAGDVLVRVAELTAAGLLQEGAAAIDEAMAETRRHPLDAAGHERQAALLDASSRQGYLLDDAERMAAALAGLSGLSEPDQPILGTAFQANLETLLDTGRARHAPLLLRTAVALGWLRYEACATPQQKGRTLCLLGEALCSLGECERSASRLNEALQTLQEADAHHGRFLTPLERASLKSWAGTALVALGEIENSTARLEDAVRAFREAAHAAAPHRLHEPRHWAIMQYHLGSALLALDEGQEDADTLHEAIQACRAALEEFTLDTTPIEWAKTQCQLGHALFTRGRRDYDVRLMAEASSAFNRAHKVLVDQGAQAQAAKTQAALGRVTSAIGLDLEDKALLELGAARLEDATKALASLHEPLDAAMATLHFGNALWALSHYDDKPATLEACLHAYRTAFKTCPTGWPGKRAHIKTVLDAAEEVIDERRAEMAKNKGTA